MFSVLTVPTSGRTAAASAAAVLLSISPGKGVHMNAKEISEIRKRFRVDKSNITRIRGCYVNELSLIHI